MNTKIVFTHNSPVRTVLVNETTGQELYRIETPHRCTNRVTRVFRCDPTAPPVPNLMPRLHWDANEPHKDYDSEEWKRLARGKHGHGNEGHGEVASGVDEVPKEDSPLVANEIARLYWRWFAATRVVFEGKIRSMSQFVPLEEWSKKRFAFEHNGVSYRWSLPPFRYQKLFTNDSSKTLIAQYHGTNVFKKGKAYLEVTPAGMGMLDNIVVTFIPVDMRRRQRAKH